MRQELNSIHLARGIAALWVLVAHVFIWTGFDLPSAANPKLAVDLFMLASGFLMALHAEERGGEEPFSKPSSWWRFYARRYFRIAPVYYVTLIIAAIVAPIFLGGYQVLFHGLGWPSDDLNNPVSAPNDAWSVLAHVTFVFGVIPDGVVAPSHLPDWSLALEMQFYLAFPLIWLTMKRFGVAIAALTLGCLSIAIARAIGQSWGFSEPSLLIFKLHIFLAGICAYGAWKTRNHAHRALYVVSAILLCYGEYLRGWGDRRAVAYVCAIFLLFLVLPRRWPTPLACLARWLSDMGYGVYLVHTFFVGALGLTIFRSPSDDPGKLGLAIVFVVAGALSLSALLRHFVEKPGIQLGRRILAIERWPWSAKSQARAKSRSAQQPHHSS